MANGRTKKLDFEKGRSRAKANTPDYRARIAEEGGDFDRGGSHGNWITLVDAACVNPAVLKTMRDDKLRVVEFYSRQMRSTLVKVGECIFRFKFTPTEFAKANGISVQESESRLAGVKAHAEELLRMSLGRAREAGFEAHQQTDDRTGKTRHVLRLRFRTFLPRVEPVQWGKIYKRVEQCPTGHEWC